MSVRNVKLLIETKRDKLINIACRRVRHKTIKEEEKFTSRQEKAKRYLGELQIINSHLEDHDFMARVVSDSLVEILVKKGVIEVLYEGEFVKLYRRTDTGELLIELGSVSQIESF